MTYYGPKSINRTCVLNVEPVSIYSGSEIQLYQSPLTLTVLFQHDLINVSYLTACYLYQVMMTLHFLNDVAYDAESTKTSKIRYDS